MTARERTAYPHFRTTLPPSELHDRFTPSAADLALADANTRDDAARLTFLAHYQCYRVLGYQPSEEEIPPELVAHLRWYLQLADTVPCNASARSRRRYAVAIRQALGVTLDLPKAVAVARTVMEQAAQTMDYPADLINAALEAIVQASLELPAFSTLDRLAGEIRTEVNDAWCATIMERLTAEDRQRLDGLLRAPAGKSDYQQIKQTPESATLAHLDEWFKHLTWLKSWGSVSAWLEDVPAGKILHMADEAKALDAAEIRDYTPPRRYARIVSLLYHSQVGVQDELVKMLIRRIASLHRAGKERLDALLTTERDSTEQWVQGMADIGKTMHEGADNAQLGQFARGVVERFGGAETFLVKVEAIAKYHGNN